MNAPPPAQPDSLPAHRAAFYVAAMLVLLVFAALHWAAPFRLPMMVDEAIGIGWARDVLNGLPFEGLRDARWLDSPIHAIFRPLGPESLGLARTVTGLAALLTCASAIGLGCRLHSKAAGLLAGLLYATLPYSVFFDRQVLGDPFAAAFGGVMAVSAVTLARQPRLMPAALVAVTLAAAIFSKFAAVLLAPLPLLAALLLAPRGSRERALLYAGVALLLTAMLILGVLLVADRFVEPYRSPLNPAYEWNWNRAEAGGAPLPERWPDTAQRIAETFGWFVGWPLVALALASAWFIAARPRRREALWLWAAGVGIILPFLAVTTYLPARYFSFVMMPFVLMAAITAVELARLAGRTPARRQAAGAALALALLGWSLPRSVNVIAQPGETTMPRFELDGYYGSRYSAMGLERVRAALLAYQAEHPGPVHVVFDGVRRMYLHVYWGGRSGALWPWDGSPGQQQLVARWLIGGESVAFLDTGGISPDPLDTETRTLGEYPGSEGQTYRLRLVTGYGAEMLRVMLGEAFGHPKAHTGDYAALVEGLPPGERVLVAYPPHQADVLAPLVEGRGVELAPVGAGWPLDAQAAQEALVRAAAEQGAVSAVFFNETVGDPERHVERWLAERLFWQGERWYGPVRVVDYVSAPDNFTQAAGVVFGGLAALDAAGVQPVETPAGHLLLVRLDWHATVSIDRSYKVAAHILSEDDQIAAQHDGVPVGYLHPTNAWIPANPVIDRFVIPLPADLSPGRYEVRVALYDSETLARLPVGGGGDSAAIGEVAIGAPSGGTR